MWGNYDWWPLNLTQLIVGCKFCHLPMIDAEIYLGQVAINSKDFTMVARKTV